MTIGTNTLSSQGSADYFVAKYNSNGTVAWARSGGGNGSDFSRGLSVDQTGDVFIVGSFASSLFASGTVTLNNAGQYDAFISKYDNNGNFLWAKKAGGPLNDFAESVASNSTGAYFTGAYSSATIQVGGIVLSTPANSDAMYLANLDPAGNNLNAISLYAGGGAICVDGLCSIYLVHRLISPNTTFGNFSIASTNNTPKIFTAKLLTGVSSPTLSVAGPTSLCVGMSVTLTASGANSYTWIGGPASQTAVFSPTINTSYIVAGSNVSLSCSNIAIHNLIVHPAPVITINPASTVICSGDVLSMTANGAVSYNWTGGVTNGLPFSPSATAVFTVTGTNNNSCTGMATSTVIVNPLPTVTAASNRSVICVGESATLSAQGANLYTWSSGGNMPTKIINPTLTASYSVTGTDANGCSKQTVVTQTVNQCLDLNQNGAESSNVKIFPNPNRGAFYIDCPGSAHIAIFSQTGAMVIEIDKVFGTPIQFEGLEQGIYFVRLTFGLSTVTEKIVILSD